jgi:hypothetical protein
VVTSKHSRQWFVRLRSSLGIFATGVAAFASLASLTTSEYTKVSLAEQSVVFSSEQREYSSRFAVVSNLEHYDVVLTFFSSKGTANPQLTLRPIGEGAANVLFASSRFSKSELLPTVLTVDVQQLECSKEEHCTTEFEVIVTKDVVAEGEIKGVLSISAAIPEEDWQRRLESYVAIEPRD